MDEECTGADWETRKFKWPDYVVFVSTLLVSLGIGIFYGFFAKRKDNTTAEFLMGNKQMTFWALGISLTLGYASAISILGNASEMYNYGTQYVMTLAAFVIMVPFTVNLFLPLMRELGLTSIYEYLDRRFSNGMRLLVALLYFFMTLMYISVVVYAPALALRQVTGLGTTAACAIIFVVAIAYSSLGGLKAVVWSDVFQSIVIMSSLIMVLVRGTMIDGGASTIWQNAYDSGRIEFFNFDPDPRTRHTFWTTVVGASFYWIGMNSATQTVLQRLLSVETQFEANLSVWLSGLGMYILYIPTFYIGLMMYTHFMYCDPLLSKSIETSDQLLPLYVMEVVGDIPGLAGLFVAGVFSASLSTVGSALNAVAASMLRDLLDGGIGYKPPEKHAALITRLLSALFGVLSFCLTFLVAQLGGVLQIAISFNGMVIGVILAIFTLGAYVPWSNTRGVLTGAIIGLGIMLWLGMGAQVVSINGTLVQPKKPVGTDCEFCDVVVPEDPPMDEVFNGYRISYLWYSPMGLIITLVSSIIASLLWDKKSYLDVDPNLVAKVVRNKFIKYVNKHKPVADPSPERTSTDTGSNIIEPADDTPTFEDNKVLVDEN